MEHTPFPDGMTDVTGTVPDGMIAVIVLFGTVIVAIANALGSLRRHILGWFHA